MALDKLSALCDLDTYLPEFTRVNCSVEKEEILETIKKYLQEEPSEIAASGKKFIQLYHLLKKLPVEYLDKFEDCHLVISGLWNIYLCQDLIDMDRSRIEDILTTLIRKLRIHRIPPSWMGSNAASSHFTESQLIALGQILHWQVIFEDIERLFARSYRSSIGTSSKRRKGMIVSKVKLANVCRSLWDASAVGYQLRRVLDFDTLDLSSIKIFYVARLALVFVGNEFWYKATVSGDLFRWWSPLSAKTAPAWDTAFVTYLFRGIKYGWYSGCPLNQYCRPYLSLIFQLTAAGIGMAETTPKATHVKQFVPGEFTSLLPKSINILETLGKVIAFLITPIEHSDENEIWGYLESFVAAAFPLSHPSSPASSAQSLASFTRGFFYAYIKRVSRERMSTNIVKDCIAMDKENNKSYRLGLAEDQKIGCLFLPLLLQGTHSKNLTVCSSYELCVKYLAHLLPDSLLEPIIEHITTGLDSVTESSHSQTSLRLLGPLMGIIVQRTPSVLSHLLNQAISGISTVDPFKTFEVVTLYQIFLALVPCVDLSEVQLTDDELLQISEKNSRSLFTNSFDNSSTFISLYNYPDEADRKKCMKAFSFDRIKEKYCQLTLTSTVLSSWAFDVLSQLLTTASCIVKEVKKPNNLMSNMDHTFATSFQFLSSVLLERCDDNTVKILFNQFIEQWILMSIAPEASKISAYITHVFIRTRPAICFSLLFEILSKQIKTMVKSAESTTNEDRMKWILICFVNCLRCRFEYLESQEESLQEIIMSLLNSPNKMISKFGIKAIRRIVESCFEVSLLPKANIVKKKVMIDLLSVPLYWLKDTSVNNLSNKWLDHIEMEWNEPTKKGIEFGNRFLVTGLTYLGHMSHSCVNDNKLDNTKEKLNEQMKNYSIKPIIFSNIEKILTELSMTKRLARTCSIARKLLKSVSSLYPDERTYDNRKPKFPNVSPIENKLALTTMNHVAELCLSIARLYLGVCIDDGSVQHIDPILDLKGTEDSTLIRKLLKLLDQILTRRAWPCILRCRREDESSWNLFSSWLNPTVGVHSYSLMQDLSHLAWEERIQQEWLKRIGLRRSGIKAEGLRKNLIMLTGYISMLPYAENRKKAQNTLKTALTSHYGMKKNLLNYLIRNLQDGISELRKITEISSNQITKQVDINSCTDDNPDETNAQTSLCHAKISGFCYTVENNLLLRLIWNSPHIAREVFNVIFEAINSPIDRNAIRLRLDQLVYSILGYRNEFKQTPQVKLELEEKLMQPLLKQLIEPSRGLHWRYQLIATAVLSLFHTSPSISLTENYALWLIEACNNTKYYPLLNTLSGYVLALCLKQIMNDASLNIPTSIINAIQQKSTVVSVATSLIHGNHESCRTTRFPELAQKLVIEIIKIDSSWPKIRGGKEGKHLSLHNCTIVQTVLEFQDKTAVNDNITEVLSYWFDEVYSMLRQPSGEIESLVAACEIVGGMLRASNSWGLATRTFMWQRLHVCIVTMFQKLDQDLFPEFLDAVMFGLDNIPKVQTEAVLIPLMNIGCSVTSPPDLVSCEYIPPDFSANVVKSSLEVTKRLKLLTAVLKMSKNTDPPKLFLQLTSELLSHPYKQMRAEVAKCVCAILDIKTSGTTESTVSEVLKQITQVVHVVQEPFETASDVPKTLDLTKQRSPEMCTVETLITLVITLFNNKKEHNAYSFIVEIIPLLLDAVKYPEPEIVAEATRALIYCANSVYNFSVFEDDSYQCYIKKLIDQIEKKIQSSSWRVRLMCIQLALNLGRHLRIALYGTEEYNRLINLCVNGLTDSQSEVRTASTRGVATLVTSLPTKTVQTYIHKFLTLAGPNRSKEMKPSAELTAGVLGLAALVQSAPYHVPDWLPFTITELAKYGHPKALHSIRKEVQQRLQDFFSTHQDAWAKEHVKKFSEEQLSTLEAYRGLDNSDEDKSQRDSSRELDKSKSANLAIIEVRGYLEVLNVCGSAPWLKLPRRLGSLPSRLSQASSIDRRSSIKSAVLRTPSDRLPSFDRIAEEVKVLKTGVSRNSFDTKTSLNRPKSFLSKKSISSSGSNKSETSLTSEKKQLSLDESVESESGDKSEPSKQISESKQSETLSLSSKSISSLISEKQESGLDSKTSKSSAELETSKNSSKLETPKNSSKLETPKNSSKLETPKNSSKSETPKSSSKSETPKSSCKSETPKSSSKSETPKSSSKSETRKSLSKSETPKSSSKSETPKSSSKPEMSKISKKTKNSETFSESEISLNSQISKTSNTSVKFLKPYNSTDFQIQEIPIESPTSLINADEPRVITELESPKERKKTKSISSEELDNSALKELDNGELSESQGSSEFFQLSMTDTEPETYELDLTEITSHDIVLSPTVARSETLSESLREKHELGEQASLSLVPKHSSTKLSLSSKSSESQVSIKTSEKSNSISNLLKERVSSEQMSLSKNTGIIKDRQNTMLRKGIIVKKSVKGPLLTSSREKYSPNNFILCVRNALESLNNRIDFNNTDQALAFIWDTLGPKLKTVVNELYIELEKYPVVKNRIKQSFEDAIVSFGDVFSEIDTFTSMDEELRDVLDKEHTFFQKICEELIHGAFFEDSNNETSLLLKQANTSTFKQRLSSINKRSGQPRKLSLSNPPTFSMRSNIDSPKNNSRSQEKFSTQSVFNASSQDMSTEQKVTKKLNPVKSKTSKNYPEKLSPSSSSLRKQTTKSDSKSILKNSPTATLSTSKTVSYEEHNERKPPVPRQKSVTKTVEMQKKVMLPAERKEERLKSVAMSKSKSFSKAIGRQATLAKKQIVVKKKPSGLKKTNLKDKPKEELLTVEKVSSGTNTDKDLLKQMVEKELRESIEAEVQRRIDFEVQQRVQAELQKHLTIRRYLKHTDSGSINENPLLNGSEILNTIDNYTSYPQSSYVSENNSGSRLTAISAGNSKLFEGSRRSSGDSVDQENLNYLNSNMLSQNRTLSKRFFPDVPPYDQKYHKDFRECLSHTLVDDGQSPAPWVSPQANHQPMYNNIYMTNCQNRAVKANLGISLESPVAPSSVTNQRRTSSYTPVVRSPRERPRRSSVGSILKTNKAVDDKPRESTDHTRFSPKSSRGGPCSSWWLSSCCRPT